MQLFECLLLSAMVVGVVPDKCALGNDVDEFIKCASVKSIQKLEEARRKDIVLAPGVKLETNLEVRSPKNLDLDLPTNNTSKLLDLLLSKSLRFLTERTLKIHLPMNTTSVARAFEEGRGKMKKMMGPLILGLGTKMMTMVPLLFGGVLFLATKALLVGKVAFVLSAILFIQMFFNGRGFFNGGGTYNIPTTYGVPTTYGTNFGTNNIGGWGGNTGPYRRSMETTQED